MLQRQFHRSLTLTAVLGLCTAGVGAQPMPGGLDPGPHAVGFRVITVTDASRPFGPKPQSDAPAAAVDRARRLAVHVWYPAAGSNGPVMTLGEYAKAAAAAGTGDTALADHRQLLPRTTGVTLDDNEWARYLASPFGAIRDTAPAAGRFPLLAGMLRPVSSVTTGEYLASHGYVVAFVQPPARETIAAEGLVREALVMAQHVRDMELAIAAMREQPFVHALQLGALGYSGDGLAQLVLAMRHPDIDAVAQLESGYYAPIGTSSYQEVTPYDTGALRAPMLFVYSENLGRNTDMQLAEIEKMRYAPRYLLYLGEPRMTHADFVTEGITVTETLAKRPAARAGVVRAYQAAHRYQRTFFDAFVKRDAVARATLNDVPVPPAPGPMIEVRERPAVVPAMSRGEFRSLLDRDTPQAMQLAREGLARDPLAAVFEEAWLNAVGYELLQRGQAPRAVEVFTLNVEAHPGSANTYDSLSETLEGMKQATAALQWAEKGLAALPADRSTPPDQRKGLEDGLRARVARLTGK